MPIFRQILTILAITLALAGLTEIATSWYYHKYSSLGRVASDVRARLTSDEYRVVSIPSPFYRADPDTGITTRPGAYTITFSRRGQSRSFLATINQGGNRITASKPMRGEHGEIWIFGDSYIWGWGTNDNETMAWHVQEKFPDYRVRNFAQNGWGHIQNLLRLRQWIASAHDLNVAVIFLGYADSYPARNVAAPSRMRAWQAGHVRFDRRMSHPRAWLGYNGNLIIDRIPLIIDIDDWTPVMAFDPPPDYQSAVTARLIDEFAGIARDLGARLVVGYIEGAKVPGATPSGVTIADFRVPPAERDDFGIDSHPGPRAQAYYARRLAETLTEILKGRMSLPRLGRPYR